MLEAKIPKEVDVENFKLFADQRTWLQVIDNNMASIEIKENFLKETKINLD